MSALEPKVILRHCDEYDPDRIRAIVREGLDELGLRPTGRVLVKPNLVIALPGIFDHAFTRPELLDGLLGALKDRADEGIEEIAVGERCGITMPTRLAYEGAGYPGVVAKHNVAHYFFDEVTQVPVRLRHPDRLRDVIYAPEPEHSDYCWGGCPGAIEEAIEVIRQLQPDAYDSMRPMTLVFGAYDGPIEPREGEKVVFMGDCCRWKGRLRGTEVTIPSCYVDRQRIKPCNARMTDIFVKMLGVYAALFAARGKPYLRITGCPVSVAEQILVMATLGRTKNPYFAPATVGPFLRGWLAWRWARIERWLLGKPYQSDQLPVPAKATAQLEDASGSTEQDS
ncbi:MAG: hypothetical protein DRI90_02975 [Deltaproteobacteria bacterium]|nr:MAG: hypothetical protein DRI90_02975 [Deltaproteobacteria bacterium]